MKRALLVAVALALVPVAASAQPKGAEAEARAFFDIGAKAYKAGNYPDAIQAFSQAFQRAQRPGLAFSLGQAHRMQYSVGGKPENLRESVRFYREYLKLDPNGARKGEVLEALDKLVPQLERLSGDSGQGVATPEQPRKPRVMISTQTPGASIAFDGKSVGDYFASEVEPGKHKFVVSAPGFVSEAREVAVDAGKELPPFTIDLKEKPAFIVVKAVEGATISIDGRVQGEAPLPPLEVKPGPHFVAVTLNGHEAYTRELDVGRGERATVQAKLETTTQRKSSWVLIGIGAGGLVAGGVLGYVALNKESKANDIYDATENQGNLPPSELDRYDSLTRQRDNFRLAALITGGAGLVIGATGFVLRVFDEPRVRAPELEERKRPGPPGPQPGAPKMELSAVPLLGPGVAGGGVMGRF